MTDEKKKETFDSLLDDPFQTVNQNDIITDEEAKKHTDQVPATIDSLSTEHQEKARDLASKIDDSDIDAVINYGASAQQKISDFSQEVLDHVQNQDTSHIGESLNELMFQLKESDPNELTAKDSNIFKRMFKKINQSIYETTAKYQKIGAQVDKIASRLDKEKNDLLKDNIMLNDLYDQNYNFHEALNVYIAAGELRLEELENQLIPEAITQAENSSDGLAIQRVNDLNQFQSRLEKRVHDLKTARQLTIQQAPQIRLIQNTNQALAEKIQTSINTAIPLWKNQVVIALTLLRQQEAITAQRQVSETTNEMLVKNAEMLKISSVETAKENERAVVDIETLEKTQSSLIETLEEVLQIQKDGHQKRKEAEKQLYHMENQMKDQLLKISNQENSPHNS